MINGILRFASYIIGFLLLASHFGKYINPAEYTLFAFIALGFPVLFLLNLSWLTLAVFLRKKWGFISLAILIFTSPTAGNFFEFCSHQNKENKTGSSLKMMSYNVRLFDLYNWSSNKSTRNKMFRFIKEQDADVLCFQEFYYTTSQTYPFNTLDTLLELQSAINHHTAYTTTVRKTDNFGIATFSKYPIINKGEIRFEAKSDNICIYTDIAREKDTIRVYNMHLSSVRFLEEDYKFIDEIENSDSDSFSKGISEIYRKLNKAFKKRGIQISPILKHISKSPFPHIVCGDFNDTPSSNTYFRFSEKLKDTFLESGCGTGSTYAGGIPFLRIDYIMCSEDFTSKTSKVHNLKYSDHFPLTTKLDL